MAKARKIAHNIYHLLRGQVYIIEKKGIFTFGGGVSRDLQKMLDINMWFEREMPSKEEFIEGAKQLKQPKQHGGFISFRQQHPKLSGNYEGYPKSPGSEPGVPPCLLLPR